MQTQSNPLTYSAVCHNTATKPSVWIIFTVPPQLVQRGGFLGTSCRSRDRVPLLTGFSLIRTWVTQPCLSARLALTLRLVQDGYRDGSWYSASYKETKALFPLLFSKRA